MAGKANQKTDDQFIKGMADLKSELKNPDQLTKSQIATAEREAKRERKLAYNRDKQDLKHDKIEFQIDQEIRQEEARSRVALVDAECERIEIDNNLRRWIPIFVACFLSFSMFAYLALLVAVGLKNNEFDLHPAILSTLGAAIIGTGAIGMIGLIIKGIFNVRKDKSQKSDKSDKT